MTFQIVFGRSILIESDRSGELAVVDLYDTAIEKTINRPAGDRLMVTKEAIFELNRLKNL